MSAAIRTGVERAKVVTLQIDDQDVTGRADQSVLEVAREHDIDIPTLCHLDGLSDIGACRLCLVEVKGSSKLQPACVLKVAEGLQVYTQTERLRNYRRLTLEMLFAEGNHVCAVCVANGHCELQDRARDAGVTHVTLTYHSPRLRVDASHDRYVLDPNRCILCTRCVRVCDEIEGAHTWDVEGRGIASELVCDLAVPWGSSDTCTSCGKCVQVCPTGALFHKGKAVAEMVKRRDFLPYLTLMRGDQD